MDKKVLIFASVALILGAGLGFFGGMAYAKNMRKGNFNPQNFAGMQQNAAGGKMGSANNGSGFALGEIISKDEKSITIKLRNGGSKIIYFSEKTEIGKFTSGAVSDLAIGQSVNVTGTNNSDGTITAQSVQIQNK